MTVLEFIFGILALAVILVIATFWIGCQYNDKKLEKENENLKEQIKKLRLKLSSEEYKKNKIVNEEER